MMSRKTFLPFCFLLVVIIGACNDSSESKRTETTTNKDTTQQSADTIKSDPRQFSDPH